MESSSHDGMSQDLFLSGSLDKTLKMWDVREGKEVHTFKGHEGSVNSADFSPDGNWIASGGSDGKILIWDIRTETILQTFDNQEKNVSQVKFNPKTFALAASMNKTVKYFDLDTFDVINQTSHD